MADFHQNGVITTLHRLGDPGVSRLEASLREYSDARPVALVLPCLLSELRGEGLKGIVDVLRKVSYLQQIVVSISGSEERDAYDTMRRFWDGVVTLDGSPPTLLWNSGARVQGLYQRLHGEGLDPGVDGKGRSTWLAYGYVLATGRSRVIAVHDCDIRRLQRASCWPGSASRR